MVKNINDKWGALSISERASLINTYVQSGVLDLNKMREHYNNFDDDGKILDGTKEENLNALGGPLYNKHNPIESFSGSSKIPIVRKSLTP